MREKENKTKQKTTTLKAQTFNGMLFTPSFNIRKYSAEFQCKTKQNKKMQQLHLCMRVMYTLHYNTYVMKSEVNKFNSLSQNGTDPLL